MKSLENVTKNTDYLLALLDENLIDLLSDKSSEVQQLVLNDIKSIYEEAKILSEQDNEKNNLKIADEIHIFVERYDFLKENFLPKNYNEKEEKSERQTLLEAMNDKGKKETSGKFIHNSIPTIKKLNKQVENLTESSKK